MPAGFRAIRFHEYGGSDKLVLETLQRPELKPGEVLVEVHFAGVNPVDWKIRSGYLKAFMPVPLPFTPGIDVSGTIAELGPGVSGLEKGQAVLVQGAAGGVGQFALQFAKLKGARVLGTASEGNLDFVKGRGADQALDYKKGLAEAGAKEIDAVIDAVGGETLEKSYELVKAGGILVTVAGQVSEEKAKARGISALGSGRGPAEHLKRIAAMMADGSLRTEVGKIFPLAEAKAAQDLSQTGHGRGRILLKAK